MIILMPALTPSQTESLVLIATVTAVFGATEVTPEKIAEALLEAENVTTVRIDDHGCPSVFRVDVAPGALTAAADEAREVAATVAENLCAAVDVVGVTLTTDNDRIEVFRAGR